MVRAAMIVLTMKCKLRLHRLCLEPSIVQQFLSRLFAISKPHILALNVLELLLSVIVCFLSFISIGLGQT
jgi:hypothetical protein